MRAYILTAEQIADVVADKEPIRLTRSDRSLNYFVPLPVKELTVHEADYLADSLVPLPKFVSIEWEAAPLYLRQVMSTCPDILAKVVGNAEPLDGILLVWENPDEV